MLTKLVKLFLNNEDEKVEIDFKRLEFEHKFDRLVEQNKKEEAFRSGYSDVIEFCDFILRLPFNPDSVIVPYDFLVRINDYSYKWMKYLQSSNTEYGLIYLDTKTSYNKKSLIYIHEIPITGDDVDKVRVKC